MSLLYALSLLFFAASSLFFVKGVSILFLDMKNILNNLFFAVCISLSLWAFCFSMMNVIQNYEDVLLWRRLSSLGWGTAYSFLMHFLIILTERQEILKKRWVYLLIYVPSVLTVSVFGVFSNLARQQYNLVYTNVGWINVLERNGWNYFFIIYYMMFSIIGVFLLYNWGKNSKELKKKKQAHIIIASSAMAVLFGTITDIGINTDLQFNFPQMAPLFAIVPLMATYYSTKRYGLMKPKKVQVSEPGMILNEANRGKIYQAMSKAFIIGGLINYASQFYFNKDSLVAVLVFSTLLFSVGITIQAIERIVIREDTRDLIFTVIIAANVPIITLKFIQYGSVTIWAVSFIFMMVSVVFNKRLLMCGLGVSILFTQVLVWIKMPAVMVEVNEADYFVRIGLLCIAICMAYYINRIYINRLRENEEQMKFQKMVSIISSDLIGVNESNIEEKIELFLKMTGEYFKLERTCFISLADDLKLYRWCSGGINLTLNNIIQNTKWEELTWLYEKIMNNDMVFINDIETMASEAVKEKAILEAYGFKTLIAIPMIRKEKVLGVLLFSANEESYLKGNHKELLKILSNILSDGLIKVEAEKEISYMAYYDSLTGIPNRTLFKNRLEQEIHLAKQNETLIGVFFIDLDSFKAVNDTMGHLGGNKLLKVVASRLSSCVRKHDTIARFAGDEFLVQVTQATKVEDIKIIADRILQALSAPITIDEQEFFVTASMGISIYPIDGEETETLIKNADLAMYTSKDNGKHQYTLCSSEMREAVLKKTRVINYLYRALERKEFIVYYQPQVCTESKKIIGIEALLRWNNPKLGMVSPGVFIPLAEQIGVIETIGKWVLKTACHQNKEWQKAGLPPLRMAVNLSVEQFQDKKLISFIGDVLNETGLEGKYLELEITESTAVQREKYAMQMMSELKNLGVSIAIDDFGTEYSSLGRLKILPIDKLKIDMSFVRNISESKKDEAIVKTIIQLAKNLQLSVIAEGVEKEGQYQFLKKEQCDEIQGFYFYKPMSASELEAILRNQANKK